MYQYATIEYNIVKIKINEKDQKKANKLYNFVKCLNVHPFDDAISNRNNTMVRVRNIEHLTIQIITQSAEQKIKIRVSRNIQV